MPSEEAVLPTDADPTGWGESASGPSDPQEVGPSNSEGDPTRRAKLVAHIQQLQAELIRVTAASTQAAETANTGNQFFLLRRKWRLIQQIFEAENKLRLLQ